MLRTHFVHPARCKMLAQSMLHYLHNLHKVLIHVGHVYFCAFVPDPQVPLLRVSKHFLARQGTDL